MIRPPRAYWDFALIPLTRGEFAIVDVEDMGLGMVPWCAQPSGSGVYAVRGRGVCERLHRTVAARAGISTAAQIDHINRDTLDCRRANLRAATASQNCMNRGAKRDTATGLKGASWIKSKRRWVAQIERNGVNKTLGHFDTAEEAHAAYCEAARLAFGEFYRAR